MAAQVAGRSRRSLIVGIGALATAGAVGLWSWRSSDHSALAEVPAGWYLISRQGASDGELELVAWNDHSAAEHVLATEVGSAFLNATLSPDRRYLALLKRVLRGSMPTDAIGLYDFQTFKRLAVMEVQIAFQRTPTFTIEWSADSRHLAIPYNTAERTLLFGVNSTGELAFQSILAHAFFQFHPTRADIGLYATPAQLHIVQLVADQPEQLIETLPGFNAQWSPDGSKLAYLELLGSSGMHQLIIRDQATMQAQRVPVHVQAMAWSPDSRRIALYCLASNDPFNVSKLIPPNLLPGWQPAALEPRLMIYDTVTGATTRIDQLRSGFELAYLQWLQNDWLLVIDVKAKRSFMSDRRGQQHRAVTLLDDYTSLLRWIAQP